MLELAIIKARPKIKFLQEVQKKNVTYTDFFTHLPPFVEITDLPEVEKVIKSNVNYFHVDTIAKMRPHERNDCMEFLNAHGVKPIKTFDEPINPKVMELCYEKTRHHVKTHMRHIDLKKQEQIVNECICYHAFAGQVEVH